MKNSRLFVLISALVLCFLFLFAGCELLDDLDTFLGEETTAQAADQTTPTAQPAEPSSTQRTVTQTTEVSATEEPAVADLEYCKRAAVTALTNWCAFDGQKHSYSDKSGDREYYYMFVTAWGTWTQSGSNSYHVVDLLLRSYGKEDGPTDWDSTAYKFTLDVTYNAANNSYIISKVYSAYKEKGDYSYTNMPYCESHSLFTVPYSLIEKDR